jgi:branched-subunit amino acid aminotransferase/4-amino-4-deoxychorismate lyase
VSCAPALIETVRVREGRAPLWPLHLRRLQTSCRMLGLPYPMGLSEPHGGADRVCRLEVASTGWSVSERAVGSAAPLRLVTSRMRHQPYRHKTTERAFFAAAVEEARSAGADDALLLTEQGEVAEGAIWCVFWWEGDTLCAPALDLDVLPGVSRRRIEALAGPVAERRAMRTELAGLPIFVSNAARGVVEVAELDDALVPRYPETETLRQRFWG